MKFLIGLFFLAVIGGSIYADYRWKRWMAARQRERQAEDEAQSRKHSN